MKLSRKYRHLFNIPYARERAKEDLPPKNQKYWERLSKIDTVIVTGGRFSAKSFGVSTAAAEWVTIHQHRLLFSRFTLTSAEDSVIADFEEKTDLLGYDSYITKTQNKITVTEDKGKVVFKGINSGAKNRSAQLKSLKDFSAFIVEEAEEIPEYPIWEKIKLSIRANDLQNINVLILNPTTKEHWIFEHFFEDAGVPEGFNGIKNNVLYIHTSYLDVPKEFIPEHILREFERGRIAYEKWEMLSNLEKESASSKLRKKALWYKHIVMGGWLSKAEGVVYDDWEFGEFDESLPYIFAQDYGYSIDPTTLVKVAIDKKRKKVYVHELLYKPGLSTAAIINENKTHVKKRELIIADSAEGRLIADIKKAGLNIKGSVKGPDSIRAGIKQLQGYKIIVTNSSINIPKELNNYVWHDKKSNTPVDAYNHLLDAIRYAVMYLDKKRGKLKVL